mgnify:CR=1 FL=1
MGICLQQSVVAGALVFGEKSLKATDAITISAIQTFITAVISIAGALLFDDISYYH